MKAPGVCLRLQSSHLRVQVPLGLEGSDLLLQQGCQFAPAAHGHARDVVDGLVAIQLHALAARVGQRVNDVGCQALQAQLEHLEQAHRACTDDDGIGFLNHGQGSRRWGLLGDGAAGSHRCAIATLWQRVVQRRAAPAGIT